MPKGRDQGQRARTRRRGREGREGRGRAEGGPSRGDMTDAVRSGQRCRLLAMAAVVQHAAGFLPTPSFSPLPLPALAKSVTPLQIAGPFRKTRCCPRSVIRMADDEPIPEAIVEAEAKATPMRPVRQQAYVLLGAISLIVGGGLAASKQGGVAAADSLAARSIAPMHAALDHTPHEYDPCIKKLQRALRNLCAVCLSSSAPRSRRLYVQWSPSDVYTSCTPKSRQA